MHLRLRYNQTLAFGCPERPYLAIVGSGISISRPHFDKTRGKVEKLVKKLVFGAFWGNLRPFQLEIVIFPSETLFDSDPTSYRVDRMLLHSQLRGFNGKFIFKRSVDCKRRFLSF